MTTVLVTGATGGIGSALVAALLARGDDVVALDRVARTDAHARVRSYVLDVLDEAAVTAALVDAVAAKLAIRHVVAIAGGALPAEKGRIDPAEGLVLSL